MSLGSGHSHEQGPYSPTCWSSHSTGETDNERVNKQRPLCHLVISSLKKENRRKQKEADRVVRKGLPGEATDNQGEAWKEGESQPLGQLGAHTAGSGNGQCSAL